MLLYMNIDQKLQNKLPGQFIAK